MQASFSLMTANLRSQNPDDGENSFLHRVAHMATFFCREAADVYCFQELTQEGLRSLEAEMPGYVFCAFPRDEAAVDEAPAIAFRTERFEIETMEVRWLSETPDQIASRYPDQSICPRNYHLLLLRERESRRECFILNTHFDHEGAESRLLSSKQIVGRIRALREKQLPVVFCGDLNAEKDSPEIRFLDEAEERDGLPLLRDLSPELDYTFHSFRPERLDQRCRIDYIYVTRGLTAQPCTIYEKDGGRFLSDHRFIATRFFWDEEDGKEKAF